MTPDQLPTSACKEVHAAVRAAKECGAWILTYNPHDNKSWERVYDGSGSGGYRAFAFQLVR